MNIGMLMGQFRLPDVVYYAISRIYSHLIHSERPGVFLPLALLLLVVQHISGKWGRKKVGIFGSILYTWRSQLITHMLSTFVAEIKILKVLLGVRYWKFIMFLWY